VNLRGEGVLVGWMFVNLLCVLTMCVLSMLLTVVGLVCRGSNGRMTLESQRDDSNFESCEHLLARLLRTAVCFGVSNIWKDLKCVVVVRSGLVCTY
jgi:hypothetical protein